MTCSSSFTIILRHILLILINKNSVLKPVHTNSRRSRGKASQYPVDLPA